MCVSEETKAYSNDFRSNCKKRAWEESGWGWRKETNTNHSTPSTNYDEMPHRGKYLGVVIRHCYGGDVASISIPQYTNWFSRMWVCVFQNWSRCEMVLSSSLFPDKDLRKSISWGWGKLSQCWKSFKIHFIFIFLMFSQCFEQCFFKLRLFDSLLFKSEKPLNRSH